MVDELYEEDEETFGVSPLTPWGANSLDALAASEGDTTLIDRDSLGYSSPAVPSFSLPVGGAGGENQNLLREQLDAALMAEKQAARRDALEGYERALLEDNAPAMSSGQMAAAGLIAALPVLFGGAYAGLRGAGAAAPAAAAGIAPIFDKFKEDEKKRKELAETKLKVGLEKAKSIDSMLANIRRDATRAEDAFQRQQRSFAQQDKIADKYTAARGGDPAVREANAKTLEQAQELLNINLESRGLKPVNIIGQGGIPSPTSFNVMANVASQLIQEDKGVSEKIEKIEASKPQNSVVFAEAVDPEKLQEVSRLKNAADKSAVTLQRMIEIYKSAGNSYVPLDKDLQEINMLRNQFFDLERVARGSGASFTASEQEFISALLPKLATSTPISSIYQFMTEGGNPAGKLQMAKDILAKYSTINMLNAGVAPKNVDLNKMFRSDPTFIRNNFPTLWDIHTKKVGNADPTKFPLFLDRDMGQLGRLKQRAGLLRGERPAPTGAPSVEELRGILREGAQ